jgi:ABC-type transport system involved in cytochrome c biogenesis permease component
MTFPVIARELKLASGSSSTYVTRFLLLGIAALLLIVNLGTASASNSGASIFWMIQVTLFAYCILEGVRATSDCLSSEERNGTLGLLFLTELSGVDVVLGKIASNAMGTVYTLLGMLPFSALALLLGGVSVTQLLNSNIILICFLFFCLSCGIFVSAMSVRSAHAALGTLLLIASVCAFPITLSYLVPRNWRFIEAFGPWGLLESQLSLGGATRLNWIPVASFSILFGASWILVWSAGRRIERLRSTMNERMRAAASRKTLFARVIVKAPIRTRLLESNPVKYLLLRYRTAGMVAGIIGGGNVVWGLATFSLHSSDVMMATAVLAWISLKVILMLAVSRSVGLFSSMRESGTVELLLTTPLTPKMVIHGCETALARTFFIPILMVFLNVGAGLWSIRFRTAPSLGVLIYAVLFLVDYQAIKWVSMAYGLLEKKSGTAVSKTFFLLILFPALGATVPILNLVGAFTWPLAWWLWASFKVKRSLSHWAELGSEGGDPGTAKVQI